VTPGTTLEALQAMLAESTGVAPAAQELLAGFPPRPLALPADRSAATVASLGLAPGDALVVRRAAGASPAAPPATAPSSRGASPAPAAAAAAPAHAPAGMSEDEQLVRAIAASLGEDLPPAAPPPPVAAPPAAAPSAAAPPARPGTSAPAGSASAEPMPDGRVVLRRAVADDNSCLFSAVGYVARGSRAAAPALRALVAEAVLANPEEWSEAVLGRPPAEYARWIVDARRWGGAIELAILAARLGLELAAHDIQTGRCDVYGQGAGFPTRALLIYNGLHYDALAVAERRGAREADDARALPAGGAAAAAAGAAAARLATRLRAGRQFTDTATFSLRCGVCGQGLRGEKEALAHAEATGHTAFAEF
jgi:ubiquitin thioesterase OTU1